MTSSALRLHDIIWEKQIGIQNDNIKMPLTNSLVISWL